MRIWLGTCLTLLFLIPGPSFADDCLRNEREVISIIAGSETTDVVKFNFESRREAFNKTSFNHVWCIEADRQNLNIADFHWGTGKEDCKYVCALVEPGRGGVASKLDGTGKTEVDGIIKYSRKNRDDWRSIKARTISTQRLGGSFPTDKAITISIELRDSPQSQEGVLQVDRLSEDLDGFVKFLREQKSNILAGGLVTTTLPINSKIAKALSDNNYEKYDPADFVRAQTTLLSSLSLNNATPYITYWASLTPEKGANFSSSIFESRITMKLTPLEEAAFPFITGKAKPLKLGEQPLGVQKITGRISYIPTRLQIAIDDLIVATTDVSLFAERKQP